MGQIHVGRGSPKLPLRKGTRFLRARRLGAVWYYFANRNYHGYDSRFILLDEDFNGNTLVYFSGDPMLSDYWRSYGA